MLPVVKTGNTSLSLQTYKQMPKVAKTPEGYTLKVNGQEMRAPQVALTGGGAHPMYTYIFWEGKATWFGAQFPTGTELTIEVPQPAAPKQEAAASAAPAPEQQPEQPKASKKQK